ncbi:MAG: hypothetical protein SOI56_04300 [Eubacteriales bacterium]|jgi:hypothetical protein
MRDKTISVRLLIQCVLRKWRQMLILCLVIAGFAGGFTAYRELHSAGSQPGDGQPSGEAAVASSSAGSVPEEGTEESEYSEQSEADFQESVEIFRKQAEYDSVLVNNSILMKIDPNAEGRASVDLIIDTPELDAEKQDGEDQSLQSSSVSSDGVTTGVSDAEVQAMDIRNAYDQFVSYGLDWSDVAEEYDTEAVYLQELVSVKESDGASIGIHVTVIYPDEEGASDLLDEVIAQVEAYHDEAAATYGDHEIVVQNRIDTVVSDPDITSVANDRLDELETLINTTNTLNTEIDTLGISDSGADHTDVQTVSMTDVAKKSVGAALAGFAAGIVIWILVGICWLLISGKVFSASELNRQYGLTKVAVIPSLDPRKRKGLDRFFWRDSEHYYSNTDRDVCFQVADENLSELTEKGMKIALVGDVDQPEMDEIAGKLAETGEGREITAAGDVLTSPEALKALKEADGILIAARTGRSHYRMVDRILETVGAYKKDVIGSVIID